MRSVLFVDDEVAVLRALERVLRAFRQEWRMVFALGSSIALANMEREQFDAVVSDLGMPGMDGRELLSRARASNPRAVCILLSGHLAESLDGTQTVADEILIKPCPAKELAACLTRHFAKLGSSAAVAKSSQEDLDALGSMTASTTRA
jgi:DNA-binding response OmpR family regulator